jgi:hypothetical protein
MGDTHLERNIMTDKELLELAAKAAGKRERHGMNKSPEHRAWVHMKQRCTNTKKREYWYFPSLEKINEVLA